MAHPNATYYRSSMVKVVNSAGGNTDRNEVNHDFAFNAAEGGYVASLAHNTLSPPSIPTMLCSKGYHRLICGFNRYAFLSYGFRICQDAMNLNVILWQDLLSAVNTCTKPDRNLGTMFNLNKQPESLHTASKAKPVSAHSDIKSPTSYIFTILFILIFLLSNISSVECTPTPNKSLATIEVQPYRVFRYPSEWDPRHGRSRGGYLQGK